MQLKFFFIGVWRVYFCVLTGFGYQSQRGAFHSSCLIWPDIEMPWDAITLHTFVMNDINIRFFFSSFSLILFWNLNVPFLQTIISTMSRLCVWAMLCCDVMCWTRRVTSVNRMRETNQPSDQAAQAHNLLLTYCKPSSRMDFPLDLAVLNWTQWQKHSNAHEIFNSEQQQQANEKKTV